MKSGRTGYVPALGYDILTPLYDPLVRVTTRERTFKGRLLAQARIDGVGRILDLGCGTGTLLMIAKQSTVCSRVFGLDGDARVLTLARRKAERCGQEISLVCAVSSGIPFTDCSFERVLSSLMLHHLTRSEKVETFRETLRVLQPTGEFHVADWGRPHNALMRVLSLPVRVADGMGRTRDNIQGRLPELLRHAGFEGVSECTRFATMFGTLSLYSARKPRNVGAHAAQSGEAHCP